MLHFRFRNIWSRLYISSLLIFAFLQTYNKRYTVNYIQYSHSTRVTTWCFIHIENVQISNQGRTDPRIYCDIYPYH